MKDGGKSMRSLVRKYLAWRPVWMIPMIYVGVSFVAAFDLKTLVRLATEAIGVIVMECGVGDTLFSAALNT